MEGLPVIGDKIEFAGRIKIVEEEREDRIPVGCGLSIEVNTFKRLYAYNSENRTWKKA